MVQVHLGPPFSHAVRLLSLGNLADGDVDETNQFRSLKVFRVDR